MKKCPICGHIGIDLVFVFECSNSECQNYVSQYNSTDIFAVVTDPNGSVTGVAGNMALNYLDGEVYVCIADGTTWVKISIKSIT